MHRSTPCLTSLLTAAVLAAAGCSSTAARPRTGATPTAAAVAGESRFPVVHEDWARLGYRLDWVGFPFGVNERPVTIAAMLVQPDGVVIQRETSVVTLMEPNTGRNRWSTELTGPLTRWVGIARDDQDASRLCVVSESEVFMLAPATGNLLARQRLGRVVNTPPVMAGNAAVFGTSLGVVHAHNFANGLPLWAFASRGSIEARLLDVGGTIAAVSQGGDVMFLNADGSMVGRGRIFGALDADPATDGQLLFVASRDQSLWAFDVTGATVWRHRTSNPLTQTPVVHDGTLYVDLGIDGLTAMDPASGSVKWSNPKAHGRVVASRAGRLLVWNHGTMLAVDPASGAIAEQVALPGVSLVATDAFSDGNLYAVSDRGVVAKFMVR